MVLCKIPKNFVRLITFHVSHTGTVMECEICFIIIDVQRKTHLHALDSEGRVGLPNYLLFQNMHAFIFMCGMLKI